MHLQFSKVILHNFLSYGHAEINLENNGYCLVKGINRCPVDNAISNGSGKSSFGSAICWALTGQTIQGVSSNIKNMYVAEKSCYVTLDFTVDADHYVITRYKEPKSDMTIYLNGKDISGKGIKESEIVLAEHIPDLTSQLVASIIILGQGLPDKFTANTPSKRKEILERLSKSDFMIEDLKKRINNRDIELKTQMREVDDKILSDTTAKNIHETQITEKEAELTKLKEPHDFDSAINELDKNITDIENKLESNKTKLDELNVKEKELSDKYNKILAEKNESINNENIAYTEKLQALTEVLSTTNIQIANDKQALAGFYADKKNTLFSEHSVLINKLSSDITTLSAEIIKLKSVKDVCPTCGQKLPGVFKQDTTEQENKLKELKEAEAKAKNEYKQLSDELANRYNSEIKAIDEKASIKSKELSDRRIAMDTNHKSNIAALEANYTSDITETNLNYKKVKEQQDIYNADIKKKQDSLVNLKTELQKIQLEKENYEESIKKLESELYNIRLTVEKLDQQLLYNNNEKQLLSNHLTVISQLTTLIKRDFRGFLLNNIINYIENRAKEYAVDIFGTDYLCFELDGNNINISYCNKTFECLSGGEQQKVDIIIQFAIRDMMQKYLGFSSNIILLDEIFDGLDVLSTNAVISLISKRLHDIESIFIISHHADELEIPVDTELVVIKNEQGVSQIQ